jgi:hypothetical protein
MKTTIVSNGSRWRGQKLATLEQLFQALASHPLEKFWRKRGIECDPYVDASGDVQPRRFWGNFADVSHVFEVETDDPALIERFRAAFKANVRDVRQGHPCMGDGPSAREAEKCPCYESHWGKFEEEEVAQ